MVRDLEALAHRVQRGEYFSYGKKLAFAHRLEAFDGPSAPWPARGEVFPDERLSAAPRSEPPPGKREVRLREAELADMLDAMGERASFILERSDGGAAAPAPDAVDHRGGHPHCIS